MSETPSSPVLAVGDVHDDDAAVVESFTRDQAEPPTPAEKPTADLPQLIHPRPITRLMTTTTTLLAAWGPTMLLPADPDRVALDLRVSSTVPADTVRWSDDSGKIQSVGGAALLYSGDRLTFNTPHTGPVWVSCPDATGVVTVTAMAVTS